jgi:CubicO group peptidase (beta-lactamase class C family)
VTASVRNGRSDEAPTTYRRALMVAREDEYPYGDAPKTIAAMPPRSQRNGKTSSLRVPKDSHMPIYIRVAWVRFILLAFFSLQAIAAEDSRAREYLVRMHAKSGAPGMSAAVSVRGKIVFAEGVGKADLVSGMAQTARTVHNIGSVSKVETAVAVMQLVEQGKVDLDAEIQRYAPWFPRKPQPITLRQILTHTSGIRHYNRKELVPGNPNVLRQYDIFEESTRFWRDDPLVFVPGTHFSYSSFAVNLLQAVIESASGEPFEGYMRKHVWEPAGMRDSQFDVPVRVVANRGRAYKRDSKTGQFENGLEENVSYKYASGGMLASDEDLCRFGHALNRGLLLKPASLAEMYRLQLAESVTHLSEKSPSSVPPSSVQALGFRISKDPRGHIHAGHSGSVKGAISQFYNYHQDDVVVAVYMNLDSDDVKLADIAETLAGMFDSPDSTPAGK